MSFADCIRKSDIGVDEQDITAIQVLIDSGMEEREAVETHLSYLGGILGQESKAFKQDGEGETISPGEVFTPKVYASYEGNIKAILAGEMNLGKPVPVSTTPPVLQAVGIPAQPISVTGSVIDKMHYDHGLSERVVLDIPRMLADPVMVLDSDSTPGSYVVVSDVDHKGDPVILAVHPNKKVGRVDVNVLASAYGKEGAEKTFRNWVGAGLVQYVNANKNPSWSTTVRLQLPWVVQSTRGSNKSLITEGDIVKKARSFKQEDREKRNQYKDLNRGSITFTGFQSIIKLSKYSNLSTFLHEAGHLFLETEAKLSEAYGSPADQQVLFKWLGVESIDQIETEHHEKFARGFESYLREGKAPSVELRDIFAAFRQWLIRLYQSITSLEVEINNDIRQYMDRLLATEEEIERAMANPAYDQFFRSKEQAGMTDKQWEEYQKRQARAKNKATQTIDEKLLTELRKRRSKEWKEEKAPLIEEEKVRLSKEPVYQLMDDLKQYPMEYDLTMEIMGWEKQPGKLIGRTKKGGVNPEEYAEVYGYRSVSEMVSEILDTESLGKAADAAAEDRMIGKYGDILNDGSLEEEVRQAVHNDDQAKLLLDEIRVLSKKAGQNAIDRDYLKAQVKNLVSQMTREDLKPGKYYYAEIKAAKRAVTATDPQEQLEAKTQQIINHYLYREISEAKQNLEKWRRHIRRVQTREYKASDVAPAYSQNMKVLANLYEMRRAPEENTGEIERLLSWYEAQLKDPNQLVELQLLDLNLLKALEAKETNKLVFYQPPTYDEMTLEQVESVYTMLRHLRFVGGKLSDEARARRSKDIGDLTESIDGNGIRKQKTIRGVPGRGEGNKRSFAEWMYSVTSLRNLMRTLDGFKQGEGQAVKKIYRTIEDANSDKLRLRREVYDRLKEEVGDISTIGLDRKTKDYRVSDGSTFSIHPESRFMMALYWGTESSRDAIREGFGLTDQDVEMILSDMTEDQLKMVNAVWKLNESLWPDLSSASVKQYGVAPPKLDATPFEVKGIKLTGGHMRLFYDSTRLELKKVQEEGGRAQAVMPSKAGSLHARVGSGGRPPALDIHNITRALDENIHFISFAEPALYIRSLVNSDGVRNAIETHYGPGFYKAMLQNIDHITRGENDQETSSTLAKLGRLTRQAATFKHLAYSVRNTVQQASALPIAMKEVGSSAFLEYFVKFATPGTHDQMVDFITTNSEFMKNRTSLVNREAAEFLKTVIATSKTQKAWEIFKAGGFMPQTFMDSLLAYPVWAARYDKAINEHGDHGRAVSEADTAVSESVGSGSDLHLGGLFQQNNNQWIKTFTVFGTWFNAYYQRIYRSTKGGTDYLNRETVSALVTIPLIVGTLSAILVADAPADDEDWITWATKRHLLFMAGTMPIVRDIAGAFSGFSPKTLIGGGQESLPRIISEIKSLAQGKQSALKATSDITKGITTVVPVPGIGNVTRVMDYIDSYSRGKEGGFNPYQMFTEGPNRNR
ncbi:MAG: hypothetical protein ABW134_11845 [Candidatus Thiodiazotropha endolucinida]